MLEVVNPDLLILLAVAGLWLTAGVLADALPGPHPARALRRRTGTVLALVLTGLAAMVAISVGGLATTGATIADRAMIGLALPAIPAVVVATQTVRRLRRLWSGAGAFSAAPGAPTAPALRAAAAHPMIAVPVQIAGLASVPAAVTATGLVPLTGPGLLGLVLTAAVLAVVVIGVRHALRHSRLTERAVTLRPASSRAAGALHV